MTYLYDLFVLLLHRNVECCRMIGVEKVNVGICIDKILHISNAAQRIKQERDLPLRSLRSHSPPQRGVLSYDRRRKG